MAKDRIEPCEYYISAVECSKGREPSHSGYCQHCKLYKPRAKKKHLNLKKQKLQKLRMKETE